MKLHIFLKLDQRDVMNMFDAVIIVMIYKPFDVSFEDCRVAPRIIKVPSAESDE